MRIFLPKKHHLCEFTTQKLTFNDRTRILFNATSKVTTCIYNLLYDLKRMPGQAVTVGNTIAWISYSRRSKLPLDHCDRKCVHFEIHQYASSEIPALL